MKVMFDGRAVDCIKMEGQFTLDTCSQIYTEKDGEYVITIDGRQIVVSEEELQAQQESFASSYEQALCEMEELNTEENW
jgi:hypothetical protein